MCLTFQILSSVIQRGLFIKPASQAPSYTKFREQLLALCVGLSLMLYPWKNLLLTQTLPFTDKKGVFRQAVSYTHTPTHILTDLYTCVYRQRYALWEPLYEVWNINSTSSRGKSGLLLIILLLWPSNCLCNSCQASQAETKMNPTSSSFQETCSSCICTAAPQLLCVRYLVEV